MSLKFQAASNGECPVKAVLGCKADDGTDLAVGRAAYKGGMHPGKLNPKHTSLYISYGGEEIPMKEYEILVQEGADNVQWVATKGQLPPGQTPLKTGYEANGDPLYVARGKVNNNGSMAIGKLNPKYGLAYLPYGGKEVSVGDCEVLCMKPICDLS